MVRDKSKTKKDNIRLKEKEKKEESIFAHNKFQNDRINDIAKKSAKAAEFQAERDAEAALAAAISQAAERKQASRRHASRLEALGATAEEWEGRVEHGREVFLPAVSSGGGRSVTLPDGSVLNKVGLC